MLLPREFLWQNWEMCFIGEIDTKNSNFEIFESILYIKSIQCLEVDSAPARGGTLPLESGTGM